MRIAVVLACVLATLPAAAEDLVLRQRSNVGEAGGVPREETVYITQHKVVNDAPAMRTIVDLDAGTITLADKARRTYSTMTLDQLGAQMEALRRELDKLPPEQKRMMGALFEDEAPVVVKATGRTETIAGYPATEHTLKGGPYDGVVWTTTAVTPPAGFERWKALDRQSGGLQGAGRQLGAAMQKIEGLPLRTRIQAKSGGQTVLMTTEVLDVKRASPPSEVLVVPPGFKRETAPQL